jgi:hypothetical protein
VRLGHLDDIIRQAPLNVFPVFNFERTKDKITDNVLTWMYLLYHLAWKHKHPTLYAELGYIVTEEDFKEGCQVKAWNEYQSPFAGFHPEGVLTCTAGTNRDWEAWRDRHTSADKQFPEVFAAFLTKNVFYGSMSAIELLIPRDVASRSEIEDRMQTLSYLGLRPNEDQRQASREGYPHPVELRGKLQWCLLIKFLKQGGAWSSRECLKRVWVDAGGTPNPKDGTMDDAVKELRQVLKPLDIDITNRRGVGWRLEQLQ